jgi:uncharacterized protein
MDDAALAAHDSLIAGLMHADAYAHAAPRIERIQTHISTVLLAGDHAYKIKKPVNLGFLDFTTLSERRRWCEEEVRINRRTAPQLYLGVVPITGTREHPRIGGAGAPIECAVHMRRFDGEQLFDALARRGELSAESIDALGEAVARLHREAARVLRGSPLGSAAMTCGWMRHNIDEIRALALPPGDDARLAALGTWTAAQCERLAALMTRRHDEGFVCEGHGDLHLRNIVLLDGRPTLFDAIEFSAELRFIDAMNDVAFAFMDLLEHGLDALAWRFVSAYLEATGDTQALALLRAFAVYRALVRAKVALLGARQAGSAMPPAFAHGVALAERLTQPAAPLAVLMHGLSGSGKSTVAAALAGAIGAVRVRSDVERKRLFGLAPLQDSGGAIYSADATRRTYARLAQAARDALAAGVSIVVDAAFLKQGERADFVELARSLGAAARIVACEAPPAVLRERVSRRQAGAGDASEATLAVLAQQAGWVQPLAAQERAIAEVVGTDVSLAVLAQRCAALAARWRDGVRPA